MPLRFTATVAMTEWEKASKYGKAKIKATRQGKRVLKIIGECQSEGGTVAAKTWHEKNGTEWMEVECLWPAAEGVK